MSALASGFQTLTLYPDIPNKDLTIASTNSSLDTDVPESHSDRQMQKADSNTIQQYQVTECFLKSHLPSVIAKYGCALQSSATNQASPGKDDEDTKSEFSCISKVFLGQAI